MMRPSLGGLFVLSLVAAVVPALATGCEDTSTPETPAQKVPPPGTPTVDGGGGVDSGDPGEGGGDACKSGLPTTGLQAIAVGDMNGRHAALTLDDKGAPIVVHAKLVATDNTILELYRWDTTCSKWSAPIKVDAIGSQNGSGRQIAVAFDKSTGAVGVAYQAIIGVFGVNHHYELRYAQLAKGATTFGTPERVEDPNKPTTGGHEVDGAGLAMAAGKVYVAYREDFRTCGGTDCDGAIFRARDANGTWGPEIDLSGDSTLLSGSLYGSARNGEVQVAVDSDNKPAVAWLSVVQNAGLHQYALFARPDAATITPTIALQTTEDVGTDIPDIAFAFDGKKPRIATVFHRDPSWPTSGQTEWFIASNDGVTWDAPVALPHDHGSSLDTYVSLAIGPGGKVAVLSASESDDATSTLGQPKILTSTNLTTFTVGGVPKTTFSQLASWVTGAYGPDGKLNVVMKGPEQSANPQQIGLLYFHE